MWVSKKRLETLEKKVADLEKQVQDQSLEKVAIELEGESVCWFNFSYS